MLKLSLGGEKFTRVKGVFRGPSVTVVPERGVIPSEAIEDGDLVGRDPLLPISSNTAMLSF
jgi:hypothetical protein